MMSYKGAGTKYYDAYLPCTRVSSMMSCKEDHHEYPLDVVGKERNIWLSVKTSPLTYPAAKHLATPTNHLGVKHGIIEEG
ncbi:unnamed protein product [Linum trigynum]|uniref:Uncharacterized protein n=1 Tax=Linum trigynum TaxID=586398 RepID=A0AAV2EUQ3_9ROSI